MRITSQQQLLQHVGSGGLLKVGDNNQVLSQSGAARFFQKIGDAFLSISERGRASIANRNAALRNAVADMLRNDPNFNPVGSNGVPPLQQSRLQKVGMQITIARSLGDVPPSARDAMRHLVEAKMEVEGYPGNHDTAEIAEHAAELINTYKNSSAYPVLHFNSSRGFSKLRPNARAIMDNLADETVYQLAPGSKHLKANGLHDAYAGDAARYAVRSINGRQPMNGHIPPGSSDSTKAALEQELINSIPAQFASYKAVISMFLSQAGIVGALSITELNPDMPSCAEDRAPYCDFAPNGFNSEWYGHSASVNIQGNKALFEFDSSEKLIAVGNSVLDLPRDTDLAANHYSLKMELDMSEPWTPGMRPKVTCTGLSIHPEAIDS